MKHILRTVLPAAMLLAGAAMATAQEDALFAYSNGKFNTSIGNGAANPYDVALKIADPDYVGMQVKTVRILLAFDETQGCTDYKVWTANNIGTGKPNTNETVDVTLTPGEGLFSSGEGTFANPVTLTEAGLYVGYTFNVPSHDPEGENASYTGYPVPMTFPLGIEGSGYVQPADFGFYDYCDKFGCVPIQVVLAGTPKAFAVQADGFTGTMLVTKGQPINLNLKITNKGSQKISTLTYEYTIDGEAATKTIECPLDITLGQSAVVPVTLDAVSSLGEHDVTVEITEVNGEANEAANTFVEGTIDAKSFIPVHRPVMEEMTAAWCGFCTRGWFAMKTMKQQYGDRFIGMAYHGSDAMACEGDFPFEVGGYPSCRIDRGTSADDGDPDPYYGYSGTDLGIEEVVNAAADKFGVASIDINSEWNADKTECNVKTAVKFADSETGAGYKLGFVMIQNGICHPENGDFTQSNYYGGDEQRYTEGLKELFELPDHITDFVFDDVVLGLNDVNGVDESVPFSVVAGDVYNYEYTFKTSDLLSLVDDGEQLIQNPDEMEIVVLLLSDDNLILNGRSVKAGENTNAETGIVTVNAQNAETPAAFYNIMGQRVNNPAHGLYIKTQNGKASKVIL